MLSTKQKLEAMAENRCSLLSLLLTALLFITISVSVVSGQGPPSGECFICEREQIQRFNSCVRVVTTARCVPLASGNDHSQ